MSNAGSANSHGGSAKWQIILENARKKFSRAATCRLSSLPPGIAARTVLFGFISALQSPALLAHWLSHYSGLGVQMRRSLVVMDVSGASAAELARHKEQLASHGTALKLQSSYTSEYKVTRVNQFMRTLPRDALVVYADGDEVFEFTFVALTPAMREVARRVRARAIQVGGDDVFILVAGSTAARWRVAEPALCKAVDSFSARPAPEFSAEMVAFRKKGGK